MNEAVNLPVCETNPMNEAVKPTFAERHPMKNKCGAKTRTGTPCKRPPLAGKRRCRLHGGMSTGAGSPARPGNQNARQHGIYSSMLTDEERAIADALDLGSVDEELRLTRIRLMRALRREETRADTAELDECTERDVPEHIGARNENKYKVRDYSTLIDRLTARIESLEARRAALTQQRAEAELKQRADKRATELHALEMESQRLENERLRRVLDDGEDDPPTPVKVVVEVKDARTRDL
ncbi:HGGxSTG domain-containing protein [Burkholderia ubonensis]|uniref:HGGxSTG domain-containing protein n=1 Tax=Burkholderia ubonensis TaxID=101571 RepID=UPI0018DFA2C5|nr:HGGxSTG domain-containing protein [Burkholderia ubonensis]